MEQSLQQTYKEILSFQKQSVNNKTESQNMVDWTQ